MKDTKIIKSTLSDIQEAAYCMKQGGLVVFPTETVYGLGANALDAAAAGKIFEAKGRPSDNPLIVHVSSSEQIEKYAYLNDISMLIIKRFMPGPLTIVLRRRDIIPDVITAGMDTVAIRCPSNECARMLIEYVGVPVAAPSANISGKPSPTRAGHIITDLTGRVDYIIDGGDCEIGLESTVIMCKDDRIEILRPGAVTMEMLSDAVGADKVIFGGQFQEQAQPVSPGMKYTHYAPDAPLYLIVGSTEDFVAFINKEIAKYDKKIGILCYNNDAGLINPVGENIIITLGEQGDAAMIAKNLFDRLLTFNDLRPDVIYAHAPDQNGVGIAVYNRLVKASGGRLITL